MKQVCFCIIAIVLLTILYMYYTTTERFYIRQIYNPTHLERNPLICYVSKAEDYLDRSYFEDILSKHFPLKITNDPKMKFKADLAILPETLVLDKETSNVYPYDFLSHLKDISFALIQKEDAKFPITSFENIQNRIIGVMKGGYTERLWKKILSFRKIDSKPIIKYYTDAEKTKEDLKNDTIHAIITLMSHPNLYIAKMSYEFKINILPWVFDDTLVDVLTYYLRGLKKTRIKLKEYRYTDLKTELPSYGYFLSLFVRKNMNVNIVENITEVVFKPKGITRSIALGGSLYMPFHEGTISWLTKNGYVAISDVNEHPGCTLLAGKSKCIGNAKKYAIKEYNNKFWNSKEPNDSSAVNYLKNAHSKKTHIELGKKYQSVLDAGYMCFEDLSHRTKTTCEQSGNTWDRPCLSDSDCPFYKSNQNYPNTFGKCNKGFCEMPLGVIRKAYRKYVSRPICHNCPAENPSCCIKKELMASPDFAFKDDRMERIKHRNTLELRKIPT